jgi:hypothetical protein
MTIAMVKRFILANLMIPPNGNVCPSIRQVLAARGALVLVGIQCLNHVCRLIITVNFFPYSSQRLTFIGTLFRGRGHSPAEMLGSNACWRHSPPRVVVSTIAAARAVVMGRQGLRRGLLQGTWGFDSTGRLRQTRSACIHQRASRLALSADILGANSEFCARRRAAGRRGVLLGDGDRSGGDDRGQPQSESAGGL